ncbi:MAG: DUF1768 domain-containing protein [Saprospiraceae bacterium]|nr:DUF1768 domain-containing protein [Saprospiraceae bacterium]
MNTNNRLLVEASPYDKIWGIGISEDDDLRFNKENWVGENLLGKILTQLREDYKQTEKYTTHNVHDGNVG